MPEVNNVRQFVINSLKQYHNIHIEAESVLLDNKVDKVSGKGLSTEDFTTAYMSKLNGIESGAQVNVNANWNASSGDAQILNKPDIESLFGYAYYDSTNHRISFSYSSTSSELYNIDCSNFIVDGMVDNVAIQNYTGDDIEIHGASYLLIDFNTASGKTDIKIDLKDIFDPNNYYSKTEVDENFATISYVTNSYEYLKEVITNNEEVTASSLLDLNDKIKDINDSLIFDEKEDISNKKDNLSNVDNISSSYYSSTYAVASYVSNTYTSLSTYISDTYTSLSTYVSNTYNLLNTYITNTYTYLVDKIIENEEVIAESIINIHSYFNDLSELTSGELNTIFGIS